MRALSVEELGFVAGGFGLSQPNVDGGSGGLTGLEVNIPTGLPRPVRGQPCPMFSSNDGNCPSGFAREERTMPATTIEAGIGADGELTTGPARRNVLGGSLTARTHLTVIIPITAQRTVTICTQRPTPAGPCNFPR